VTVNVAAKWLQCLELLRVGTRRLILDTGQIKGIEPPTAARSSRIEFRSQA
jgi:hypothetical protein